MSDGSEIIPHNLISNDQAQLEPLDSLLSEAAVLGFEFGYSAADPKALVMWEAQFGDFANSAQVIIDNFICCSYTKWNLPNSLVLLLPHGQEGQGPEHSSARLERFLILCAENNMYVTNPTTPAQYFHLLRRQLVDGTEKPLVVMTPKSLLRLPAARSEIKEFTDGSFQTIMDDKRVKDKSSITNLIFTSGKVYYDLIKHQDAKNINNAAIARIEQYYPLDTEMIEKIIKSYPKVKKIRWVQEEPQNMGAWNFLFPKFLDIMGSKNKVEYVGKPESPSPAPGSMKMHMKSQEEVIKKAFK
jgi:2-oxoglutarate dehydrogenase E1 component